MLHVIQSNQVERLALHLVEKLHTQTETSTTEDTEHIASHLFQPKTILVQSPGMSQWLKRVIADASSIMANINFPLPSSYIWTLYQEHFTDLPDTSAFTKDNMTWKLMALLPSLSHEPRFKAISDYLRDNNQLKLFQLAGKIADVFDQYLVYRPDWILAWEQGVDDVSGLDINPHPWQPHLWRELKQYSIALGESLHHRANMHERLIQQVLNRNTTSEPLYIFGMSTMPKQQLQVVYALAQTQPVYFYWFCPTEHYWADLIDPKVLEKKQLEVLLKPSDVLESELMLSDVGHPLLSAWGRLGRDFHADLTELEHQQEDLFYEPQGLSLLHQLQSSILSLSHNQDSAADNSQIDSKLEISLNDVSLKVCSAHSRMRELEILKDQVLTWLNDGVISSVEDVIVMVPDIKQYSPLIHAVFQRHDSGANGNHQALNIPFAISDQELVAEESVLADFLTLLNIYQSRFTFDDVFDLFESPYVYQHFGVSEQDLVVIKSWCHNANIRWGKDGAHKAHWQLPESSQNTWEFGVKRMLSGFASGISKPISMGANDNQAVLPYSEIEGPATEALGGFLSYLQLLLLYSEKFALADTIVSKVQLAGRVIDSFFAPQEDILSVLLDLRGVLAETEEHEHQFPNDITQEVFVSYLQSQLESKGVGQRFLIGRLNFTTLMPMRSIPFKAVCLVGMNENDYPRNVIPVDFDLMQEAKPRRGDRSRRWDDRFLFLEALLSAREALYISYIGRSAGDNSPLNPSLLVTELLNYCDEHFTTSAEEKGLEGDEAEKISKHLHIQHPLQPFSDRYFLRPTSFDSPMLRVAEQLSAKSVLLQDEQMFDAVEVEQIRQILVDAEWQWEGQSVELSIEELMRFLKNPIKHYFYHKWGTTFATPSTTLENDEPLIPDSLLQYKILADAGLNVEQSGYLRDVVLAGSLPDNNMQHFAVEKLSETAKQLNTLFTQFSGAPISDLLPYSVVTEVADLRLTANVWSYRDAAGNLCLLHFRPAKMKMSDHLQLYVLSCLASLSGTRIKQVLHLASDKIKSIESIELNDAKRFLTRALALYELGKKQPLPFFMDAAAQWLDSKDLENTLKSFIGNDFQPGIATEPHVNRIYPDLQSCFSEFQLLAEALLLPALMHEDTQ